MGVSSKCGYCDSVMKNLGNEKSRTFENDAQGTLSEQDF